MRLLRERRADMTIFSPRASAMAHHVGDQTVSEAWALHCNNLIARVVDLYPDIFAGVCQLPQSPEVEGELFSRFPTLRFIIPHGGGAVPYHWGRYRGLADMLKKPDLAGHLMRNVYFDTCVYHQPGINLLAEVIDTKNILFGSEMVGAVRGIDPTTGHYFDDTKRYVDALPITADQRHAIFEANARTVFPRLDAKLRAKGM